MLFNLQQIADSIENRLSVLSKFTSTPGQGVTRLPYTKEAQAAINYLWQIMEDAGLNVKLDNSGALVGRLEGLSKDTIMIGSHYDSVKNGGAYDGIAGVVCAIEAAKFLMLSNQQLKYSLEVIATNDEEGARFHAGLFTGKVLLGNMQVSQLKNAYDADGISIYEAMQSFGLKPQEIAEHKRHDLKAFLEVHIEQGPVLEMQKKQLGIVDIIVGIKRVVVTIDGRADHSGTMPMNMRQDALEYASKVISKIGDRARKYKDTVATVGFLQVEPNIMNIIPKKVSFTVDIRSADESALLAQHRGLIEDLEYFSQKLGMKYSMQDIIDEVPVPMNETLQDILEKNCLKNKFSFMHLPSGAGHDAQIFGEKISAAMLFVPSIGGRSHCPEEKSRSEDLAAAVVVLTDSLLQMQSIDNL